MLNNNIKLISFDGIDGSGKTTQINLLTQWLQRRGTKPHTISHVANEQLTLLRKMMPDLSVSPHVTTLLEGSELAYRISLLSNLPGGKFDVVLFDSYIYKFMARAMARGLTFDWTRSLFDFAPRSDLAIIVDSPSEVALQRIKQQRQFSFAEVDMRLKDEDDNYRFVSFQNRVREALKKIALNERVNIIDGNNSIDFIQGKIRKIVFSHLFKGDI